MWTRREGELAAVSIDAFRCIGCGCCVDVAPEFFRFDGQEHSMFIGTVSDDPHLLSLLEAAVLSCPARAITVRFR